MVRSTWEPPRLEEPRIGTNPNSWATRLISSPSSLWLIATPTFWSRNGTTGPSRRLCQTALSTGPLAAAQGLQRSFPHAL